MVLLRAVAFVPVAAALRPRILHHLRRLRYNHCLKSSSSTRCSHSLDTVKPNTNPTPRVRQHRRQHIGQPKSIVNSKTPHVTKPSKSQRYYGDERLPVLEGSKRVETFVDTARKFRVLGIETSCDDTAAAVVDSDGLIEGEAREGQENVHGDWGGVVPGLARDLHTEAIDRVVEKAVQGTKDGLDGVDAVAVTMGPGLEVCLRVGFWKARDLARKLKVPFVAVNHLEAHCLVARMGNVDSISFPFLTLLISGGHCQLLWTEDVGNFKVIGGTLDDALGEAYDKVARMLGLPVGGGGGPALEVLARSGSSKRIPFRVPMTARRDCDFSFAGLKTSVRTVIQKFGGEDLVRSDMILKADIAASFQHVAVRHLEMRTKRALQMLEKQSGKRATLVVAGGVAANEVIRTRLQQVALDEDWGITIAPAALCTDNGAMVAWAGIERLRRGIADEVEGLGVRARWPLGGKWPT